MYLGLNCICSSVILLVEIYFVLSELSNSNCCPARGNSLLLFTFVYFVKGIGICPRSRSWAAEPADKHHCLGGLKYIMCTFPVIKIIIINIIIISASALLTDTLPSYRSNTSLSQNISATRIEFPAAQVGEIANFSPMTRRTSSKNFHRNFTSSV